ncbi:MAG: hypothetical protein ACD_62C00218G0001 [uncultured bacterium]|nr:MAG: hypothetical protein ACD_62C00218G0001 [uncultured bacterium]
MTYAMHSPGVVCALNAVYVGIHMNLISKIIRIIPVSAPPATSPPQSVSQFNTKILRQKLSRHVVTLSMIQKKKLPRNMAKLT